MSFVKHAPADHPQATLVEAAGLRWLKEAEPDGGAPVVSVVSADPGLLEIDELRPGQPTAAAAEEFGRRLAITHSAGSSRSGIPAAFGQLPPEHPAGQPPLFGPAEAPIPLGTGTSASWGTFHAQERLAVLLRLLWCQLGESDRKLLQAATERIAEGNFDDEDPPSRIHGDLWSGNVFWAEHSDGHVRAMLIDPAAHAGHREEDIALMHLFGLPQLDAVLAGYQSQWPLLPGWQDRVEIHQFFCLLAHWQLFGPAYAEPTRSAARRALG